MTDEQKQESLIAEYAASVVATAPPLTLEQADLIRTHIRSSSWQSHICLLR